MNYNDTASDPDWAYQDATPTERPERLHDYVYMRGLENVLIKAALERWNRTRKNEPTFKVVKRRRVEPVAIEGEFI